MAPRSVVGLEYYSGASVSLPIKIRCNRCDRVKPLNAYSSSQTTKLAQHIARKRNFDAERYPHIPCMSCTPKPVVELRCSQCEKDKAIDKFNKTQRKSDTPWCEPCMKEFREFQPVPRSASSDNGSECGDSDESEASNEYFSHAVGGIDKLSTHLGTLLTSSHPGTYASSTTWAGGVPISTESSASTYVNSSAPNSETASATASDKNEFVWLERSWTIQQGSQREVGASASVSSSTADDRAPGHGNWAKPTKLVKQRKSIVPDEEDIDSVQIESDDSDTE